MAGERQQAHRHDCAARIAEGRRDAVRAFGEIEKAERWLQKPNRALGGSRPIDLLATARGAILVYEVLGIIEYGGIA